MSADSHVPKQESPEYGRLCGTALWKVEHLRRKLDDAEVCIHAALRGKAARWDGLNIEAEAGAAMTALAVVHHEVFRVQ